MAPAKVRAVIDEATSVGVKGILRPEQRHADHRGRGGAGDPIEKLQRDHRTDVICCTHTGITWHSALPAEERARGKH
jgi:hypothetical protein